MAEKELVTAKTTKNRPDSDGPSGLLMEYTQDIDDGCLTSCLAGPLLEGLRINYNMLDHFSLPRVGYVDKAVRCLDHSRIGITGTAGFIL